MKDNFLGIGFLAGFIVYFLEDAGLGPGDSFAVHHGVGFLFLAVIFGFMYLLYTGKKREFTKKKTLRDLQNMNPYAFERYVGEVLRANGYHRVSVTPVSNDGGKDIVCYDAAGRKCVVEVKRYASSNLVGRPMIQKLHSCMIHEKAPRAIFITTSDFNQNAINYARGKNIQLINGRHLMNMIK